MASPLATEWNNWARMGSIYSSQRRISQWQELEIRNGAHVAEPEPNG